MKKIYSTFLAALFFCQILFAQQTGSFDKTISFGGSPTWPISFYVPTNYNPSNKYKLIVGLHGLGSKSSTMRNRLVTSVVSDPSSPVYNAIVVCPDNGNGAGGQTDFWTAPCDTSIITKAMNLAISLYNIDPEYIYLNGISLGGRAAFRYGLINYWRFRGIELWCPAIQSIQEANNQVPSFTYPYTNGKYIPVCITVGSEDGYIQNGQIGAAMKQLTALGAPANCQVEFGLPHGAPDSPYIYGCYSAIDKNASSYAVNDACISGIPTPFDEECNTTFTPVVTIQNKGANNLTSATINYQLDGGTVNTYAWSGTLKRLETKNVTLPAQTVSAGVHIFNAYTSQPNGAADAVPANDAVTRNFTTQAANALSEGFEGTVYPPVGWSQAGSDKAWSWQKLNGPKTMVNIGSGQPFTTTIKGGAAQTASCIMFDGYTDSTKPGKKYSIRTAEYDFTGASAGPTLSYEYAYVPLIDQGTVYYDGLSIYYSTNCGTSWTLLKGGNVQSSVTGTPSTTSYFYPTKGSDWKTVTTPLAGTGVMGQQKVMFSFEYLPNWSNIMYMDNITLSGVTGIAEQEPENSLRVFPNPLNTSATIYSSMENCSLQLMDITGKTVRSIQHVDHFPFTLERGDMHSGMYFIEIQSDNKLERMKLLVE